MLTTLFSFLGGAAFRMIWGELSAFFKARQDQAFEIERMKLQADIDDRVHINNLEAIKVQAEMGVKVVEVQGQMAVAEKEADAWFAAVRGTGAKSGIKLVDAWNGIIRPLLATECMVLWSLHLYRNNWAMDERDWLLVGAALGVFVADRSLFRRGK